MSDTKVENVHKKNRTKLSHQEKQERAAEMAAKARRQWYALAAFLVVGVVAAIVLISVFTEGELPVFDSRSGL